MTPHELDILARQVFIHLAENVPEWREVPIHPDDPEDLEHARDYKRWRRANRPLTAQSRYENNRKLIRAAERHLEDMGFRCSRIRTPAPNHASVRVAHAGSWRLCTRIPDEIAERVIILGFLPNAGGGETHG
jgi:hypothetical protein